MSEISAWALQLHCLRIILMKWEYRLSRTVSSKGRIVQHHLCQDPALKHQVYQLYLQKIGMLAIGTVLGIHNGVGVSLELLIQKLNNA